jgi:HEAT repeat protein
VSKRIVEYHISRLKDKSPEIRIKAIQELVLLEDISAMDALQEVFKNDPDEDVRKAAQQAGRELFLKIKAKEKEGSSE